MTQPDIWYVAFGTDQAVKTDSTGAGTVRSTRTFKTEVDAKLFAMQILAKGWTASAGTLNPHQPKQVVGSSQIEHWADPGRGGGGAAPPSARFFQFSVFMKTGAYARSTFLPSPGGEGRFARSVAK